MKLAVVILAAGQGKRMKSDLPKVLQPLAGVPLLGHVVSRARALNPSSMHVVYGHGGDAVREALAKENLQWALQAEQLGTGHAVMQAMPNVADDELVLVLYGDVPLIRAETLRQLIAAAGAKAMSLLTVMLDNPAGYGRIVRNARGAIQKIVEQKDASKAQLKIREGNSGIMAVPAKLLRKWLGKLKNANAQGEYYLTDIIAMAVKDKVKVTPLIAPTIAEVLGVNDKAQLAELEGHASRRTRARAHGRGRHAHRSFAHRHSRRGQRGPRCRSSMPTCCSKARSRSAIACASDRTWCCAMWPSARTASFTRTRCWSKASSAPAASSVRTRACVPARSSAPTCTSATSSSSRRPTIADGSKANHLTYLGDAVIGKGVNVGAGTITCNYDGVNKSTTTIEDGAFIGSGNMLVAPVRIGKDATTGAGSTITKDAPDGQLTLARAKQMTLEGWKRPEKKPK